MDLQRNTHIPFAQLSITERFVYWLGAVAAIGLLRPWPPTPQEIGPDIIRIWDEQKFTPADIVDFASMGERLKPHLTKYAMKDPRAWIPERPARKRRGTDK